MRPAARRLAGARGVKITMKQLTLVEQVTPGGKKAANSLRRLLSLKDEAHYGLFDVGGQQLKAALRQASDLVEFAEGILRR